ncbi:MAG: MogA/MoaB family molybdenum cofactor biosynthesis protein [Roseiflexaceae bacterium]
MGHRDHEQRAANEAPAIVCGVVTISDTRTPETDTSGAAIRAAIRAAGHQVGQYALVPDEPSQIVELIRSMATNGCRVILTNGGTGIAKRDSTVEAIDQLLEKRLPGFGELFRMLSYHEIGPAAMLSRATAGTFGETLVFCMPGSTNAVTLAMQQLIIPQLAHLVWETVRQR